MKLGGMAEDEGDEVRVRELTVEHWSMDLSDRCYLLFQVLVENL